MTFKKFIFISLFRTKIQEGEKSIQNVLDWYNRVIYLYFSLEKLPRFFNITYFYCFQGLFNL